MIDLLLASLLFNNSNDENENKSQQKLQRSKIHQQSCHMVRGKRFY